MSTSTEQHVETKLNYSDFKQEVLADYKLAYTSRQMSVLGRSEVLGGKAKFGIFGDGKEIAQIAMAKQFQDGDWRSGYYRDQTFMLAVGMTTVYQFFAQLYGITDVEKNPGNGGRSMNNHYANYLIDKNGDWKDLTAQKNTAADLSPTSGQMPRLVGLAWASKLYRQNEKLKDFTGFSKDGNEVAFGTIGDGATSEGHFFEALNAAGVLQIPLAMSVWDDAWSISVPKNYQTIKSDISAVMQGFKKESGDENGILIYKSKGWDYAGLCKMYKEGIKRCREEHIPVLFHVDEMTQNTGHSTSGTHKRYKPRKRLAWEEEYDPINQMKNWIIENNLAETTELEAIEKESFAEVKKARDAAWSDFVDPILKERDDLIAIIENSSFKDAHLRQKVNNVADSLKSIINPVRKDVMSAARKVIRQISTAYDSTSDLRQNLTEWISDNVKLNYQRYGDLLYTNNARSGLKFQAIRPEYKDDSPIVDGREVVRNNFEVLFEKYPQLITFGQDTGKLGGVNRTLEGLQKKFGELRIKDAGIRETTIIGQGIGLAMRGFRPIAEIQYLDYLLYALQAISDDVASMHWRTKGAQKVPLIVRTRGHRLEGIWHSGSPMGMILNAIRGMHVCVPRNLTQAAGMYNTLLQIDDPAFIVEPLNGYRLKEKMPSNLGEFTTPLGIPEVLIEGNDVTIVTYGSCVRIAQNTAEELKEYGISVELIDVQTLLPFDVNHIIGESLKKTNRIVFFDEDHTGGATAYMMQKTLEEQKGYRYLDSEPVTLASKEHRPAYSTDGDYFSKPNEDDLFESVYALMAEAYPDKYPDLM